MLITSVSGVRFTLDESVSDIVKGFVKRFVKGRRGKEIVVGRDTRPSGAEILRLIVKTLKKEGCMPVMAGTTPTPTLTLAVVERKAAGGIMVSASHNPPEWNALKFIGSDGIYVRKSP